MFNKKLKNRIEKLELRNESLQDDIHRLREYNNKLSNCLNYLSPYFKATMNGVSTISDLKEKMAQLSRDQFRENNFTTSVWGRFEELSEERKILKEHYQSKIDELDREIKRILEKQNVGN